MVVAQVFKEANQQAIKNREPERNGIFDQPFFFLLQNLKVDKLKRVLHKKCAIKKKNTQSEEEEKIVFKNFSRT